jgi:hypothetical protein
MLAISCPAAAGSVDSSACKRDLAEIWTSMESTLAQLRGVARAARDAKCAAYRHHVEVVTKARDVFARCKTGRERDGDLSHMDGALEDVRATIDRECAGY